ncbi:minor capsid protein [Bacillus andreraoultii]|uniref:minor capsid protein n=1 Tax=Bacillus andreraoultii TaxID=1499685 RepID=UPI0005398085|nr:minor capsid protein [Bacillus andreraoultii]
MRIEEVVSFINQSVPFRLYANEFPNEAKNDCGYVRFNDGQPPDIYIVGFKTPSIQIVIRHERGDEAERIAKDIWNLFHAKEHYEIGSTKVFLSYCDQSEPIYVGKDKNGRTIYSINITCKVRD